MSWKTLVVRESEKISLTLNNIVVQKRETNHKFFIGDLNCIIIEDYKSLITTRILTKLAEYNVLVIICNEKYEPAAVIQPIVAHHLQLKVIKDQLDWTIQKKRLLWTEIVKSKIANQAQVLFLNRRELEKVEKLRSYVSQVALADLTNREGHAAKVYFNALFGKEFSRDKQNLIVNSGLNYGYTVLRSAFSRTIVAKGLHPSISIFHSNRYDAFALADDLMEPFRPLIDYLVYTRSPSWSYFGFDEKNEVVNLLNAQIDFGGKSMYITTAINLYVDQVINFMNQETHPTLTFPNFEIIKINEL